MALVATSTPLPSMHTMAARAFDLPDPRARALDATSTDPWGPSLALMDELRTYTLHAHHRPAVLHVLHDALRAHPSEWRRALKALTTIAYCLRAGSNEVARFASAHAPLIRRLVRFEHVDKWRLDRGAAVRREARLVAGMLQIPIGEEEEEARVGGAGADVRRALDPPSCHMPGMSFAVFDPSPPPEDDPAHDSDRLAALLTLLDTSPSEDTWLNIYKLLFLLQNALPSAPNDVIRHWLRHAHLLRRIRLRCSRVGSDAEEDVRRLAGELGDVLRGGSVSDVRARARMI